MPLRIAKQIVMVALLVLARSSGAQQSPAATYRALARGLTEVAVVVIDNDDELTRTGGFSNLRTQASVELELRKAGVRVVPQESRGAQGALLTLMIACAPSAPACAATATLTRLTSFGAQREPIAGAVWSSGPTVFVHPDWPTTAQQVRAWSVFEAGFVANLLLGARQ